jgi:hypothetical protein
MRLQIKLGDRHFGRIELIGAESRAVLNTFAEHDFHDAITKWQKGWERRIRAEGTTSMIMVASWPKVSFLTR